MMTSTTKQGEGRELRQAIRSGHSQHGVQTSIFIWHRKKKKLDEEKRLLDKGKGFFCGLEGLAKMPNFLASLNVCFRRGLK